MLPTVCAVTGAMMATEAIKLLTGVGEPLIGRVAVYDAMTGSTREIAYRRDPAATRPGSLEERTAMREPDPDRSVSAEQLAKLLAGPETAGIHETPPVLLDVRERPRHRSRPCRTRCSFPSASCPIEWASSTRRIGRRVLPPRGSIGAGPRRSREERIQSRPPSHRRARRVVGHRRPRDPEVLMPAAPQPRTAVAAHRSRVDALLAPLRARPVESVPLADALGRVMATELRSPGDLPPFRNSQMDGYAVRAADVVGATESEPVTLPVEREIAAARGNPGTLAPGTAIRIMTGAPLPEGADAVIPVEDTTAHAGTVAITRGRDAGDYVREAGSDLAAGEQLIPSGTRLASRHLAAIAAAGLNHALVRSLVRVAVVSTGSELVEPGEVLALGQLPDSNGVALRAAAQASGAHVVFVGRVHDDPAHLADTLARAVDSSAELILTSGGISMGDHEVVRDLLEPLGAHVDTLAMQPGGPQALARYLDVPVICFPGNPVSSQLSFELFVAPTLREVAALPAPTREHRALADPLRSIPGRRQFVRGRPLDGNLVATVAGPGSHLVAGLAASELIIEIPEDTVELAAGDSVETWYL